MGFMQRLVLKGWDKIAEGDAKRKAGQTRPDGLCRRCDLPYADDGNPMHLLDVYLPEGARTPLPAIMDIHGGGWAYGNKELNEHYCLALARLGFAVVNINYRLVPETDLAGQLRDVSAALRFFAHNGAALGCDMTRFFITGDSAGAQLALLSAAIQSSAALQARFEIEKAPLTIRGAGLVSGVFDMRAFGHGINPLWRATGEMLFGKPAAENPLFTFASASQYLPYAALPPVHLISATDDPLHPQSAALHALLAQSGALHTCDFYAPEKGHPLGHVFCVSRFDTPEGARANAAMTARFLEWTA